MYEKLLKSILYLWGFVFLVFSMKFMISNSTDFIKIPQDMWTKVSTYVQDLVHTDTINLALAKKYGMTIEGISLCQDKDKNARMQVIENPLLSNISSSCWNGDCKVSMAFKDKVPKKIELNVKSLHSDNCLIETYNTSNVVEIVGYQLKFTITDELKEKFGLQDGNEKIQFKHETGYTKTKLNGKYEMTFDFDELLTSDILMVDGEEKLTIDFDLK